MGILKILLSLLVKFETFLVKSDAEPSSSLGVPITMRSTNSSSTIFLIWLRLVVSLMFSIFPKRRIKGSIPGR